MDWRRISFWFCASLTVMIPWIMNPVFARTSKSVSSSLDLQCPSCEKIHCTPRRAKRLKCKGGITRGICNCCPVCAKTEGESCGGDWNYLGKCDRGLFCEPPLGQEFHKNKIPEGICQRVPGYLSDSGLPAYCQPKCTPDFCKKNPRAICAAVDNADKKQTCQGDCQHTSCNACRFVHDSVDCVKCRKDDFSCMKRFAKCFKKQHCKKSIFPCRRKTSMYEEGAQFRCLVPECLLP